MRSDSDHYHRGGKVGGIVNEHGEVAFDRHVSRDEAAQALDPTIGAGSPDTAPWEQTQPAIAEPVAIAGAVGAAASVGALIAAGVPWYGACAMTAFLAALTAWSRSRVTPYR